MHLPFPLGDHGSLGTATVHDFIVDVMNDERYSSPSGFRDGLFISGAMGVVPWNLINIVDCTATALNSTALPLNLPPHSAWDGSCFAGDGEVIIHQAPVNEAFGGLTTIRTASVTEPSSAWIALLGLVGLWKTRALSRSPGEST